MQVVGYKLIRSNDGEVLQFWGGTYNVRPDVPNPLVLPNGDHVCAASVGTDYDGYKLVEWLKGPGIEQVVAEREARLARGFAYDFQDERGVHHIGTTEQDMQGWGEVTMASQAAMALGLGTNPIRIVTNTGPVMITAMEWQKILMAASLYRQPIWNASFALQALETIPDNFSDDIYWVEP